jgi:tubulin--tyrosine ligase
MLTAAPVGGDDDVEDEEGAPGLAADTADLLRALLAAHGIAPPAADHGADRESLAAAFAGLRAARPPDPAAPLPDDLAVEEPEEEEEAAAEGPLPDAPTVWLTVEDDYVGNRLQRAFAQHTEWRVLTTPFIEGAPRPGCHLHWGEYEHLPWHGAAFRRGRQWVSCYYNRKGLIRKALLARTLTQWAAKHPGGVLARCTPRTLVIDADLALDPHALGAATGPLFADPESGRWILKPSLANQARGIAIVRSVAELAAAVEGASEIDRLGGFVLQAYVKAPLLVRGRKFHLRVYALAVGSLRVHVHPEFLALFALHDYDPDSPDPRAHLTNTCFQAQGGGCEGTVAAVEAEAVRLFSELGPDLVAAGHPDAPDRMAAVVRTVCQAVGECLRCVSGEVTFLPRPNCFELFGFDFLVDDQWGVWLLEANAEPDFRQTGTRLQGVVDRVLDGAVTLVLEAWAADQTPPPRPVTTTGPSDPPPNPTAPTFVLVYERERRPW